MDPASAAFLLKGLYQTLVLSIELDQVPHAIRDCLTLVHTCYGDLATLIDLRNEFLSLLETRPRVLERMNRIITEARLALQEVCVLVEKCRPEAHGGRTPIRNRLNWMFVDSNLFKQKEPVISRQHSAVIAELAFLRQLAFSNPFTAGAGAGPGPGPPGAHVPSPPPGNRGVAGGEGKWNTGPKKRTMSAMDGQALRDMLGIEDDFEDTPPVQTGATMSGQISSLPAGLANMPPPSYNVAPAIPATVGDIAGTFNALMIAPGGGYHHQASAMAPRLMTNASMMNLRPTTPSAQDGIFLSAERVQALQQIQGQAMATLENQYQHETMHPRHRVQQAEPRYHQNFQGGHELVDPPGYGQATASNLAPASAQFLRPAQSMANLTTTYHHSQQHQFSHGQAANHPPSVTHQPDQRLRASTEAGYPSVGQYHRPQASVTQGGISYTIGPPASVGVDKPLPAPPPGESSIPTAHVRQPPQMGPVSSAVRAPQSRSTIPNPTRPNPNHAADQRRASCGAQQASFQARQRQQQRPVSYGPQKIPPGGSANRMGPTPRPKQPGPSHGQGLTQGRVSSLGPLQGHVQSRPQGQNPGGHAPRRPPSTASVSSMSIVPLRAAASPRPPSVASIGSQQVRTATHPEPRLTPHTSATEANRNRPSSSASRRNSGASIIGANFTGASTSDVSLASSATATPFLISTVSSPDLSHQNVTRQYESPSFTIDVSMPTMSPGFSSFPERLEQSPPVHPVANQPPTMHGAVHQLPESNTVAQPPPERRGSTRSVSSVGSANHGLLHLDNPFESPQQEVPMPSIPELSVDSYIRSELCEVEGDVPVQLPGGNRRQIYEAPGHQSYYNM